MSQPIHNPFAKKASAFNYDQLDSDANDQAEAIDMDAFEEEDNDFGAGDFYADDGPEQNSFVMNDVKPQEDLVVNNPFK